MKKLLVLFLLTLYMASTTGATFSMHYCKGRLVAVEMADGSGEHCPKCGAANAMECCQNEHKTVRLEKDQKPADNVNSMQPVAVLALPVFYAVPPALYVAEAAVPGYRSHAPPEGTKVHPTILHCTFRI